MNMQFTYKFSKTSCFVFIIILILGIFIFSQQAAAHATLEKVTPSHNSVVEETPSEIELQFNEPVHAKYSSIQIYDDNGRSEEHTSELQSRFDLVCRLLLEK